jgi:hypothetical protein
MRWQMLLLLAAVQAVLATAAALAGVLVGYLLRKDAEDDFD